MLLLVIALLVTSVTAGLGAATVGDTGAASSNTASGTQPAAVSGFDAGWAGAVSQDPPRASNATVNETTLTVDAPTVGAGDNLTMLTFQLPTEVADVNATTVRVENEKTATVEPVGAFYSDGQLSATFNTSRLRAVAADSETLELYATYNDSSTDGQQGSYDQSMLKGPVPIEEVEATEETPTETETPTESSTTTETQTESTMAAETQTEAATATETPGDSGPGFGVVLAVVALISVAGLARRR
jgi:PGF-CTERM protein